MFGTGTNNSIILICRLRPSYKASTPTHPSSTFPNSLKLPSKHLDSLHSTATNTSTMLTHQDFRLALLAIPCPVYVGTSSSSSYQLLNVINLTFPVWLKCGGSSELFYTFMLTLLLYFPGLLHPWYIIATRPGTVRP